MSAWRIYCEDPSHGSVPWQYVMGTGPLVGPTACPGNAAHVVNPNSINTVTQSALNPYANVVTPLLQLPFQLPYGVNASGSCTFATGASVSFAGSTVSFTGAAVGGLSVASKSMATIKYRILEGTGGGQGSSAAFVQRFLNVINSSDGAVTLASNQFTLPAGTWLVRGVFPACNVGAHRIRLWDATAGTVATFTDGGSAFGSSEIASGLLAASSSSSTCEGILVSAGHAYEFDHWIAASQGNAYDFGYPTSIFIADSEVYGSVYVKRIA